jgi:hypothetical protein
LIPEVKNKFFGDRVTDLLFASADITNKLPRDIILEYQIENSLSPYRTNASKYTIPFKHT